ncbi:DUF1801 domain-containing protein [Paucibacter sp. R3-3]|uniref:DUF1801 domain-containing protein n=1 Tax=Roseateles agri TaxID=3098619 RepID=A0ABU5DNY0_9BURK|nr:DUF1801 domain-containing protein [Paucibacter sp. R3-3]MDY0748016.1 DUF1801 domain-containing protein [Paucibacter sp. R3-3]
MDGLLRFDGARAHDPAIDAWFNRRPDALGALAQQWFQQMRRCGDDVLELFHDGCPVVCVGDLPFAYVNAFTAHVNVGFFRGASLSDPAGLLEGSGKAMRHVKLRPGQASDAAALEALIEAAYVDVRRLQGPAAA